MKSFDEQFSQSVKNAFEGYNADALADEGWKAYAKKYGKSSRYSLVIPIWAKAASVAIIIAAGAYVTNEFAKMGENSQIVVSVPVVHEQETAEESSISKAEIESEVTDNQSNIKSTKDDRLAKSRIPSPKHSIEEIAEPIESTIDTAQWLAKADVIPSTEFLATVDDEIQQKIIDTIEEPTPNDVVAVNTKETLSMPIDFMAEMDKTPKGGTVYSAGVSGMLAVVESMLSSSAGVAVGFYAEHRINDLLAIRPGLAVAKHTYGLDGQRLMEYSPTLSHDESSNRIVSNASDISIVAMEVPINLVFTLVKRKDRNIYLSAGASSMLYLDQQFSGTYQQAMTGEYFDSATGTWNENQSSVTVEVINQYSAFSRTDLFGLANLSVGFAFPMASNSTMLIEPFIQLPTTKLTSSNLQMGFGGVMLRYQFGKKGM
jgi:hypothetical protein